jgi:hypothetical protein
MGCPDGSTADGCVDAFATKEPWFAEIGADVDPTTGLIGAVAGVLDCATKLGDEAGFTAFGTVGFFAEFAGVIPVGRFCAMVGLLTRLAGGEVGCVEDAAVALA